MSGEKPGVSSHSAAATVVDEGGMHRPPGSHDGRRATRDSHFTDSATGPAARKETEGEYTVDFEYLKKRRMANRRTIQEMQRGFKDLERRIAALERCVEETRARGLFRM